MNQTVGQVQGTPLQFFAEISAIPRASGNEGGVADYLERFAAKHGLFCCRDGANNVLLRKPATKGKEQEPTVLLQAHTDMVCERAEGSSHNFEAEGIRLVQQGNLLFADGTTLGADDGFGVAIMLAALADESLAHPALECLFTSSEEIGLCGARVFDYTQIGAKRMINLDSAEEDTVIVGCCGGSRTSLFLDLDKESVRGEGIAIRISGLCGGHSGEDIHRGRRNALLLMRELLCGLQKTVPFRISEMLGGGKDNAIPRECRALIAVKDSALAMACLQQLASEIKRMPLSPEDAGLCIEIVPAPYTTLWSRTNTEHLLEMLGARSGVLEWRVEGKMPQSSRNTASVKEMEGCVRVVFSARSPSKQTLAQSDAALMALAERVGARMEPGAAYPGWESDEHSAFALAWQSAYRDVTGGELKASVIHAGLECGVICDAVPGLEAIAVGCNIHDLHSPRERMELDSFERIWQTVRRFLAQ